MTTTTSPEPQLIEGQPVLLVIDIQGGESAGGDRSAIPFMSGYQEAMDRAPALVAKARAGGVPIIFFQEAHRRDLVDFGRELDGAEGIHLLEGDPGTDIDPALGVQPDDYVIRKRRYSCFFGTELEILLKGLGVDTLILIGGHTDVCALHLRRRAPARLLLSGGRGRRGRVEHRGPRCLAPSHGLPPAGRQVHVGTNRSRLRKSVAGRAAWLSVGVPTGRPVLAGFEPGRRLCGLSDGLAGHVTQ